MAVDVIRFAGPRRVTVHRPSCRVWSSRQRQRQVEPVVVADEGWVVAGCDICRPVFGVVLRERRRVLSAGEAMVRRFGTKDQRRRRPIGLEVGADVRARVGWEADAGCRSDDVRLGLWLSWLFTADTGRRWQTDVAKAVCEGCPVRVDCLVSAVWGEEPWGVWGGATADERRVLFRRWSAQGRRGPRRATIREVGIGVG